MGQESGAGSPTIDQSAAQVATGQIWRTMKGQVVLGSAVTESLQAFQSLPVFQLVKAFNALPVMQLARAFQSTGAGQIVAQASDFRSVLQNLSRELVTPGNGETLQTIRALGQALEEIAQSPLMQYLATDAAPKIGRVVEISGHATITAKATGDARVITAKDRELDHQIVGHLQQDEDVAKWTPAQRSRLTSLINLLGMLLVYLATQNAVRSELCFFQPKLVPGLTANQLGKSVRSFMCEAKLPTELLQGYRQVKGLGVHLRADPSMKAPLVQIHLEDRALLEVLDTSNRDWLHVSVVGEEGVEGWISRRYTHQLMK